MNSSKYDFITGRSIILDTNDYYDRSVPDFLSLGIKGYFTDVIPEILLHTVTEINLNEISVDRRKSNFLFVTHFNDIVPREISHFKLLLKHQRQEILNQAKFYKPFHKMLVDVDNFLQHSDSMSFSEYKTNRYNLRYELAMLQNKFYRQELLCNLADITDIADKTILKFISDVQELRASKMNRFILYLSDLANEKSCDKKKKLNRLFNQKEIVS